VKIDLNPTEESYMEKGGKKVTTSKKYKTEWRFHSSSLIEKKQNEK
jgi:hypothetical protein